MIWERCETQPHQWRYASSIERERECIMAFASLPCLPARGRHYLKFDIEKSRRCFWQCVVFGLTFTLILKINNGVRRRWTSVKSLKKATQILDFDGGGGDGTSSFFQVPRNFKLFRREGGCSFAYIHLYSSHFTFTPISITTEKERELFLLHLLRRRRWRRLLRLGLDDAVFECIYRVKHT